MTETFLDPVATNRLRQFFGGYFHQDWDLGGSTWQEALGQFMRTTTSQALLALVGDLKSLLSLPLSDTELTKYVDAELWCHYLPIEGGDSMRTWLEQLVASLDGRT